MIKLSVNTFTWSSTEQVYPFEMPSNGKTLYCKEVNFGALPNNTTKSVAHGIVNFDELFEAKVHSIGSGTRVVVATATGGWLHIYCTSTDLVIQTPGNYSPFTVVGRLIYTKT